MTNVNENSRPQLIILKQYIKDLSYENPQSYDLLQSKSNPSEISIKMDAFFNSYKLDKFGVSLKFICGLDTNEKSFFHLELDYYGFFEVKNKNSFSEVELTHESSKILFPFARSIISNITQNGGSLTILLDNINFNDLKKVN